MEENGEGIARESSQAPASLGAAAGAVGDVDSLSLRMLQRSLTTEADSKVQWHLLIFVVGDVWAAIGRVWGITESYTIEEVCDNSCLSLCPVCFVGIVGHQRCYVR